MLGHLRPTPNIDTTDLVFFDEAGAEYETSQSPELNRLVKTKDGTGMFGRHHSWAPVGFFASCETPTYSTPHGPKHVGLCILAGSYSKTTSFKIGVHWFDFMSFVLGLNGFELPDVTIDGALHKPVRVPELDEHFGVGVHGWYGGVGSVISYRNTVTQTAFDRSIWYEVVRDIYEDEDYEDPDPFVYTPMHNKLTARLRVFGSDEVIASFHFDLSGLGGLDPLDPRDVYERYATDVNGVRLYIGRYQFQEYRENPAWGSGNHLPPHIRTYSNLLAVTKGFNEAPLKDYEVPLFIPRSDDSYYDFYRVNCTAFGLKFYFHRIAAGALETVNSVTSTSGGVRTTVSGYFDSFSVATQEWDPVDEVWIDNLSASYAVPAASLQNLPVASGLLTVTLTADKISGDESFSATTNVAVGVEDIPGLRTITPIVRSNTTYFTPVNFYWLRHHSPPNPTEYWRWPYRLAFSNIQGHTPATSTPADNRYAFRSGEVGSNSAGVRLEVRTESFPLPFVQGWYDQSQQRGAGPMWEKTINVYKLPQVGVTPTPGGVYPVLVAIVNANAYTLPLDSFHDQDTATATSIFAGPDPGYNLYGGTLQLSVYNGVPIP